MQPLDQETELPDLPLTLVTFAPLADVATKPLDFDQNLLIAATTIYRGGRHVAVIANTAITNLFLETPDLAA